MQVPDRTRETMMIPHPTLRTREREMRTRSPSGNLVDCSRWHGLTGTRRTGEGPRLGPGERLGGGTWNVPYKQVVSSISCCFSCGAMAALLPEWLRAWLDPKDIVESRELVRKLQLPESTSQFVLALRPKDSPESVVYLLSSLCFSEKAVSDVRELIAATQPKAVVALVDLEQISSFREEEKLAAPEGSESYEVPTSILGVIKENIDRDPQVVPYLSRARVAISKSVFGAGAYSDVLEAKEAAAKVNASFRYIDFPYRSSVENYDPAVNANEPESPSGESSEQKSRADGNQQSDDVNSAVASRATEGLRSLAAATPLIELRQWRESSSVALAQMFGHNRSWSAAPQTAESTKTSEVPSEIEGDVPGFAVPFLEVFVALFDLYRSQALGEAYVRAVKVFQDVEKGQEINPSDLYEACRYRVALEMCRVRMNNIMRESASKVPTRAAAEFHHLPYEDKCHALLAQSLQKEAREHGTVVAVVDVNRISGIRRQWNQQLPEDVIPLIDECYFSTDEVEDVNFLEKFISGTMKNPDNPEAGQEKKAAAVVVGAGAATLGLAYLPNWAAPLMPLLKFTTAKATTLLKIGFLNSKRALALTIAKGVPGASKVVLPMQASAAKSASASAVKAAISAEKAQAAAQGLVSGMQRQTLQAIRTSFYSAMRGTQNKQVRRSAWLLFGSSVLAGSGILWYGDKVERTLGSVAYAPKVAKLGRGLQSLSEAKNLTGLNWDNLYREVYNFEQSFLARLKKRIA